MSEKGEAGNVSFVQVVPDIDKMAADGDDVVVAAA